MIKIKKHKRNPYTTSDEIRGRSYKETLMILELMLYRACYPILKLVYFAIANARHNRGFNEASLIISKVAVNEGTTLKRLKPRARGRNLEFEPFDRYMLRPKPKNIGWLGWLKKG
ncbi:hypothetical protein V6Z11_D04G032200 [Gossypium hirsutum]